MNKKELGYRETYNWRGFVIYCEKQGISMESSDYEDWWDCWKTSYSSCLDIEFN